MNLEERKSKIFYGVPTSFIYRALYACDTGNLEYLKYLVEVKNLNFNRKFTDTWVLEGYDEAMESVEREFLELKNSLSLEEISIQDYLIMNSRLQHKRKNLYKQYTDSCPYGSLLDGMLRYAIEVKQFEVVDYLLNQDADYSKCYQTFYTSMDYRLNEIIDFLLESKLNLHIYARGYVGDRIRRIIECDKDMDLDLKNKIIQYVDDNFDVKKYRKERKKLKQEMKFK